MWGRWHRRGWQGEGGEGVTVQWASLDKGGRGVGMAKEGGGNKGVDGGKRRGAGGTGRGWEQ